MYRCTISVLYPQPQMNDFAWSARIPDTFKAKIFCCNEKSKLKLFSPRFEAWWWPFRSSVSGMLSALPCVHCVMQCGYCLLSAGEQSEPSSVPLPPCISTTTELDHVITVIAKEASQLLFSLHDTRKGAGINAGSGFILEGWAVLDFAGFFFSQEVFMSFLKPATIIKLGYTAQW